MSPKTSRRQKEIGMKTSKSSKMPSIPWLAHHEEGGTSRLGNDPLKYSTTMKIDMGEGE